MALPRKGPVLLLGGTGKVAREIAPLLHDSGVEEVFVASRSGTTPALPSCTAVRFDWFNRSTWDAAVAGVCRSASPSTAVWIVVPPLIDPTALTVEFVDLVRARAEAGGGGGGGGGGVRRFVLLGSSLVPEGGPAMGKVHTYLRELGDRGEIEWAVLRPTWFQENFAEQQQHLDSIRREDRLYSATGAGGIPWVACRDIAAVAAHALTAPEAPNKEFLVLGGTLYTYSDLAKIFTEVLGRQIDYHELTEEELVERFRSFGMPLDYAGMLAKLDTLIKEGAENRVNDVVVSVSGKRPRSFREFVAAKRDTWLI